MSLHQIKRFAARYMEALCFWSVILLDKYSCPVIVVMLLAHRIHSNVTNIGDQQRFYMIILFLLYVQQYRQSLPLLETICCTFTRYLYICF